MVPGTNSRLDTLQAAVLRAKLPHLERWNAERRERARGVHAALEGVPGPRPAARAGLGPLGLAPLHDPRRRTATASRPTSPRAGSRPPSTTRGPIHLQPAMAAAGGQAGDLPVSERLSREVIQIPLYPELPLESLERIAREIRAFCGAG